MSGPPSRIRWLVLVALLSCAGWLAVFGDKTPAGAARAAGTPAPAPPRTAAPTRTTAVLVPVEAVLPRSELAATREPMADLFAVATWRAPPPPPPPPPPPVAAPARIAEPPAAPAPSYKVLGKKHEGNTWEVFLGREEFSFVVREGDTLEAMWRVDRIAPPSMALTHLPSGQARALAIGDTR